jgi:hypothetical protein
LIKSFKLGFFTFIKSLGVVVKILQNQKELTNEYINNPEYVFIGFDFKGHIHRDSPTKALINLGFVKDKKQSLHSMRGSLKPY